jgi:hypothetical protein
MLLHGLAVFPLTVLFPIRISSEHYFYQAKRHYIDKWCLDCDKKNMDFSTYEQTIAKLRDDLFYIQKLKTLLATVHELSHTEYVLHKLEEEINVLEKCYLVFIRDVLC